MTTLGHLKPFLGALNLRYEILENPQMLRSYSTPGLFLDKENLKQGKVNGNPKKSVIYKGR